MNISFSEIVLLVGVYTIGFLLNTLILKKESSYFLGITSLFSGVGVYFLFALPILLILGNTNVMTLSFVGGFMGLTLLFLYMKKTTSIKKDALAYLISISVLILMSVFFQYFDFNLFCGDTFHLSSCAKKFSMNPECRIENIGSLSTWGSFYLFIQHISVEVGKIYFLSLLPILLICFALTFQALTFKALLLMEVNKMRSFLTSVFVSLVMITSPVFLSVTLLLTTNAFLIYYLFLFISFYWMGEATRQNQWYLLAYVFMFSAAFTRVEAPIYCTIVLYCMLFKESSQLLVEKKLELFQKFPPFFNVKSVTIFFIVFSLFYGLLFYIGANSDILSNERALSLMLLFFLMPFSMILLQLKCFEFIKNNFLNLIILLSFIFLAALTLIFYKDLKLSIEGIYGNMADGFWSGILLYVFSSVVFLFFRKRKKIILDKSILTSFFLIVFSILVFSLFRIPFYKSLYDSSNRLFVTVIPIILFYLTLKLYASQPLKLLSVIREFLKKFSPCCQKQHSSVSKL
ncbi:MAG: hypothetical protein K2X28_07255 [Alphaproteobacteria bacterium]|nr:hypothetical protein [Alphaproteobacteria bacterium]